MILTKNMMLKLMRWLPKKMVITFNGSSVTDYEYKKDSSGNWQLNFHSEDEKKTSN